MKSPENLHLRVLFFIVHPAKYHLFKNTFVLLEQAGCAYDVVIANKDILAKLLKGGGIPYTDIFPNGRKIKGLPFFLNAGINLLRTLWRLLAYMRGKKFDVLITDDVLTFVGRMKGIPSIFFTDNDLVTVPRMKTLFKFADHIIAPSATDLGQYTHKKISFKGNKALAHLHPKYFTPDKSVPARYGLGNKPICIVRLAKLNASHDAHGNPGITDKALDDLVGLIPVTYEIVISAERPVPVAYKKYIRNISEIDFTHVMAHASLFIGDSSTMAMEAAVMGIPNLLINNIAKLCGVIVELKEKYLLHDYFDDYAAARPTIKTLLSGNMKEVYKLRAAEFIAEADDFNSILVESIFDQKKIR